MKKHAMEIVKHLLESGTSIGGITREELLYELFYNKETDTIELDKLNFSDYNCNVSITKMDIKGNLYQGGHYVKGSLFQNNHTVKNNLFQSDQIVNKNLTQSRQIVGGDIRQSFHRVGGDIQQKSHKVGGEIIE